MKIDKNSFLQIFETSFWKKLKESLVPFEENPDKRIFLENLYTEITSYTYNPSNPREYIVMNKHNGISRYIPTFTLKDYCVYYLCVKLLENEIAVNIVEGTFGGWTLGNPIRLKEDKEILELDYIPFNTLNSLAWVNQWQSFQDIAKKYNSLKDWSHYINIDIANFYDCINLSILERKIRHVVPKQKQEVVTLLFHFLRNWNKKLEGYNIKTVGLPQDEIGDCSRVLANFYLQDYDRKMKEVCDIRKSHLIRFADDQIIYSNSKEDAQMILFEASKELLRINLNLNSSKVKFFHNQHEFYDYWAFEIFEFLDSDDRDIVNKGVSKYIYNVESDFVFRDNSVLKRLLKTDFKIIKPEYRYKLISKFYNPDFLGMLSDWHFKKIKEKVDKPDEFYELLNSLVDKIPYNSYHYNLLEFFKKDTVKHDTTKLLERINELKIK